MVYIYSSKNPFSRVREGTLGFDVGVYVRYEMLLTEYMMACGSTKVYLQYCHSMH